MLESELTLGASGKGEEMKTGKTLGLAALAAMALMAFMASSASATTLLSGEKALGNGDVIDFSIPAGSSTKIVSTDGNTLNTCSSTTIKLTLNSAHTGSMGEFTWGGCTYPTTTVIRGKLEFISTGGTNGEVKADSTLIAVTFNTMLFGECTYGITNGTKIGTLSGNPATFTANAVLEKIEGPEDPFEIACPLTAKWIAIYSATEPANFHIEP